MLTFATVGLLAATLFSGVRGGVSIEIESERDRIDLARSFPISMTVVTPADMTNPASNLLETVSDCFRGCVIEDSYIDPPTATDNGSVKQVVHWNLRPKPCEKRYGIAPFAVGDAVGALVGFVPFDSPVAREPVRDSAFELDDLEKDWWPVLVERLRRLSSWRLAVGLLLFVCLVVGLIYLIRYLARRVKEHRMSPIERAWVELDRLLKKGLPGRGRYKDFYVELTMVVRRYVQRKYGIKAPHLTTEEFLRELVSRDSCLATNSQLKSFLESADLVKFAGVEATPDMADAATDSARGYLKSDSVEASK